MIYKRCFIGYGADIKKDVAWGSTEPTKDVEPRTLPEGKAMLALGLLKAWLVLPLE